MWINDRYCSGKVLTITIDGYILVHHIIITMPDAAIEAHKAGLDYTEPTGKNTRKAKVSYEYVVDPNNPHGPPRQRRVIEAADSGGEGCLGNGSRVAGVARRLRRYQYVLLFDKV